MKLLSWSLLFFLAAAGCAHSLPPSPQPTMARSFHGKLVPGYFVSPAAYREFIEAQLASNDGRAEAAADHLRRALAADGASAYLRTRLAEELLRIGRLDEAREELEAALRLDPEYAEADLDLGRLKLRLGDTAAAETDLRRAIVVDPSCEEAYITLADLFHARGEEVAALAVWRNLARVVPTSAVAQAALARAAVARGESRTAETHWNRALELDRGSEEARLELARLLQGEGRFDEAATLFAEAYERSADIKVAEILVRLDMARGQEKAARALVDRFDEDNQSTTRRLALGWLRLAAQQPEQARRVAAAIIDSGESPAARLLGGAAYEEMGKADAALAELAKVPPSSSEYVAAQVRVGRLLGDSGRYAEAAERLRKAITELAGRLARTDDSVPLHDLLARVYERAGEPTQALSTLERAWAKQPQSQGLAYVLASAYQRSGRWQRAVEVMRQVLKRHPRNAQALNFIGYALVAHGTEFDEARRLLERARSIEPGSSEIADSLGWLYYKLGRLDDAEPLLLRADRLSPGDPEILDHLGDLYLKRLDRPRALDCYKRALASKPEDPLKQILAEKILPLESDRLGAR